MSSSMFPRVASINGRLTPWEECVVHVRARGALFGANVFEGVRAYWAPALNDLVVFRLEDHLARLQQSAKVARLVNPMSLAETRTAVLEVLRANDFREDVHIAIVVTAVGLVGTDPFVAVDEVAQLQVTAVPAVAQAGSASSGADVCVSSWRRTSDDMAPPRIKAGSNYGNLALAHREAKANGFDAPLLLNAAGQVTEGSGFSVFLVRGNQVITPSAASGLLEGITRSTVIALTEAELGLAVVERAVERSELYVADEIFICGTMVEIVPVMTVDRLAVGPGQIGPTSTRIREIYENAVRAELPRYRGWLSAAHRQ
jgi:branched-chain amino acid aminotransferase